MRSLILSSTAGDKRAGREAGRARQGGAGPWVAGIRNNLAGLGLLLAAWFILAGLYPPYVIPSPLTALGAAPDLLAPAWQPHLLPTLQRVLAGFALAFAGGIALGIGGYVLRLAEHFNGLMVGLQAIPGTVLGIILLLVLGVGNGVPVALVALLTLPTVAINTANALRKRDLGLEQYLRANGAGRRELIRFLYLPVLIPTLQNNLSLGFGLALKVIVLGEYIGSQNGLGYLLNVATVRFDMQAALVYLSFILVVTALFEIAQNLVFRVFLRKYFYGS